MKRTTPEGKSAPRKSSEATSDAADEAQREREAREEIELDAEEQAEERLQEDRRAAERRFEKTNKNPIIAEVQRALRKKGVHVSIGRDSSPISEADRFIDIAFGRKASQTLGRMVLRALMDGDRAFPGVVAKAIKQIDPVFNRNREIAIAKKVRQYVWSLPEHRRQDEQLKRDVEKHCNGGAELAKHQWQRLRKVCLIPLPPPGRPKKKKHRNG